MRRTFLKAVVIAMMLAALLTPPSYAGYWFNTPDAFLYYRSPGYWVASALPLFRSHGHWVAGRAFCAEDGCLWLILAPIMLLTNALVCLPFTLATAYIYRREMSTGERKAFSVIGVTVGVIAVLYALLSGLEAADLGEGIGLSFFLGDAWLWLVSVPLLVFGTLAAFFGYRGLVNHTGLPGDPQKVG